MPHLHRTAGCGDIRLKSVMGFARLTDDTRTRLPECLAAEQMLP